MAYAERRKAGGAAMPFDHLDDLKFIDERTALTAALASKPLSAEDREARRDLPGCIKRLAGRLGEPAIRQAVGAAVRIMGEQFVLGSTIEKAIKRAGQDGFVCSFDMLGEGARTVADADRYEAAYANA